jgi:hypothetical protein
MAQVSEPTTHSTDITQLILDDHTTFRQAFAQLDDLSVSGDADDLAKAWQPLADLLDVHAVAEEEIFYPQLLRKVDDAEDETLDAIGDHNDIRDGVREASREPTGSDAWWAAVHKTRVANDEHMAEEEREGLADFRKAAPMGLREALGQRFVEFKAAHPTAEDLDTRDKDPEDYVERHEPDDDQPAPGGDSLGIGSLKGQ